MQRKCLGLPKMFAKAIMSLLVTLCIAATVHAQSVNVSGTVFDDSGETLIGVNILVKGTNSGTVTDFDGKYEVSAERGATLVFSYTGFTTQEIVVGNSTVIDVTLLPDTEILGEVVVIGYGQTQNKRATTTAVATITGGQIDELRTARPETALQGSAPGVIVAQTSGSPGAPLTVRMRGVGSPNASTPLYLVDGIQVPNLEYLNTGDIASISLLKDAASAAIYGSRGGNGVVLVQTKQGKRNSDKTSISLSSYYGVQNLAYKPELMNRDQYIDYYNNAVANYEMPTGFRGAFTDAERNALPDTDWYDAIFDENAPTSNIHLSFADGGEKFDYSVAGGIFNQDGLVAGEVGKSDYQRKNVRGTINADLAKNLQLSVSADYTNVTRNFLIENSGGTGTALMNYITAIPAIYPTHAENGELFNMGRQNPNPEFNGVPLNVLGAVTNPLWSIEITNRDAVQNVLLLSGALSYQPVENLNIRGSYSYYKLDALNRSFTPLLNYPEQTFTTTGFVSYSEAPNEVQNSQYNLTAEYTFDDMGGGHGLKVLGGFEVIQGYTNLGGNTANAGSYLVNDFESVNFALASDISTAIVTPGVEAEVGLLSYFGRINYDYKDKYLLSVSLRNDQSSNFGANNRSGIFPAVSAGWLLSEESFFNVKAIDLFKVRASWGVNGSDAAAPYSYVATVTTNAQYAGNPGITQTGLANPDLKWEELTQTNVGLDINMFNSALGLTVDYYVKNTADILLRANTPLSTGLNPSFVNVGTVKNAGFEVLLSYRNRVNEDFKWNAAIGMGYNQNEVTSLGENGQALEGGFTGQLYADPITLTALNQPISSFYGYVVEGIDANGNMLFRDLDKSGNDQTQPNSGDKAIIGNPLPDYTFGLTLGANYKGFDLNAYFYGVQGNDIFDATIRYDAIGSNRPVGYADNSNAPQNLFSAGSAGEQLVSDFHVQDGSFIKLKNLSLGYTFSDNIADRIRADRIRLYVAGQNLLILTKYTGADPEIGENALNNYLDMGIDRGYYPQPRSIIFGFQLGF